MRFVVLALALALALSVCGLSAHAAQPASGFFEDPAPALVDDAKRPGAKSWIAPGKSLKGYTRIALEPILVWYAPGSKYQGIEPNELAAVTAGLHESLVLNLEPKYPVVGATGAGVLHVRLAITNLVAQKKKRGLLGYTPMGFVVGTAKNLADAGPNIDLAQATIEAELLDASGTRIAAIVEPVADGPTRHEQLTWKAIGDVLDAYGKRLRARLDADNPQ